MADEPYVSPGHRLTDEEYGAVVRRAREIRAEQDPLPEPDPDLVALAAQDPDPALFPDADGDGIPDDQEDR